jgi:hypothetical protein
MIVLLQRGYVHNLLIVLALYTIRYPDFTTLGCTWLLHGFIFVLEALMTL